MDPLPLLNNRRFDAELDYQQRRRTQNRLAQRRFRLYNVWDVPTEATNNILGEREKLRKVDAPCCMNQEISFPEHIPPADIFPAFSLQEAEEQAPLSFPYHITPASDLLLPVEQHVRGLLPYNEYKISSNIIAMQEVQSSPSYQARVNEVTTDTPHSASHFPICDDASLLIT